jgi:acetyl-CoA acetyltransferase
MNDVFFCRSKRTPIGRHGGVLAKVRPDDLAAHVIGSFVGAFLSGIMNNGLIIFYLDVSEQMMIAGGLIIQAVTFASRPTKPDTLER